LSEKIKDMVPSRPCIKATYVMGLKHGVGDHAFFSRKQTHKEEFTRKK
jgi:hypothetical protein